MSDIDVPITFVDDESSTPHYAHPGDAGADLYARMGAVLPPGNRAIVPAGFQMAVPTNAVAMVCSRSGLAGKGGIHVLNAPGVIDSGFRGEVGVILHNTSRQDFRISVGDRIAQVVFLPFLTATFIPVAELPPSVRDVRGFGSTGVSDIDSDPRSIADRNYDAAKEWHGDAPTF